MASPVIQTISTFDPALDKKIYFSWTGNQIIQKRIVITSSATNIVAYDSIQDGYRLEADIPAASIQTSTQYFAEVYVKDNSGVWSTPSSRSYFYTVTTPVFQISNIAEDQIIANSSVFATLLYQSTTGELLKDFKFYLYDSGMSLLYMSDTIFYSDGVDMSYVYKSLQDNSSYYIYASGTTVHGLDINTGNKRIFVQYSIPSLFTTLNLTNSDGYIRYSTNLIIINNDNISHTFSDGYIDMINGNRLSYTDGFDIVSDFKMTTKIKCNPADIVGEPIIIFANMEDRNTSFIASVKLNSYGEDNYFYLSLSCGKNSLSYGDSLYTINSDIIDINDMDDLKIEISRIGSLYDISLEKVV